MNVKHEWQKPMASLAVKRFEPWDLLSSLITTIPFGAWPVLWWWLKGCSCLELSWDRVHPSVASPGGAAWKCLLAPYQEECQISYRGGFAPVGTMQVERTVLISMPAFSVTVSPCCHISKSDRLFHSWVSTAFPLPLHLMPESGRTDRGRINI